MPTNRHSIHNILNAPSSPPQPTANMPREAAPRTSRKRNAAAISSSEPSSPESAGPSISKRRRSTTTRHQEREGQQNTRSSTSDGSSRAPIDIDEIDLSGEPNAEVFQEALQKQRVEQVKARVPKGDGNPTLASMNCVICMDVPTDLTATSCGHLFCHTCLIEALKAGERTRKPGETKRSQCPVCRKNLDRNKPTDIIPLLIRKGKGQKRRVAETT
ncbi:hypothetical protein EJ08DRAFT_63296 [Tothia fuscella]|uniref:RING-type domain-containing protein n=1 Tax=Tothia fuscella TaxID=1048955 RepID=A0A9P4NF45_9PEZI|nr:hypothetical protein EJ08DRAFT_63296 [Tothia fuscella]